MLTRSQRPPHPPPRQRLRDPRAEQHDVERDDEPGPVPVRQPAAARHGDAAGGWLPGDRVQARQPGQLAAALPHRVARQLGPGPADPRAALRHTEAPRRPDRDGAGLRQLGRDRACA